MLLDLCFLYHKLRHKEYPQDLKTKQNKTPPTNKQKTPLKSVKISFYMWSKKNVLMTNFKCTLK